MILKANKVNYTWIIESQILCWSTDQKSNFANVEEQKLIVHKTSQDGINEG